MASKEDKLLAALRSLSPPTGGSGNEEPRDPEPRPRVEEEADSTRAHRQRSIELSLEEAGIFFLAATMLIVLAFLMGWYGRGVALPGASPNEKAGASGARPDGLPHMRVDARSIRDLRTRPSGVRDSSARRVVYTILAARCNSSGTFSRSRCMRRFAPASISVGADSPVRSPNRS